MKLNSLQDNLNKALKDVGSKQAKQIVPQKELPKQLQTVKVKPKVKKNSSDDEGSCSDESAYGDELPEKEANSGSEDEPSLAQATVESPEAYSPN